MGCHTWFYRPVTEAEFAVFKAHAVESAWDLNGDNDLNKEFGIVNIEEYMRIKESVECGTDYWWKKRYGMWFTCGEVEYHEFVDVIDGKLYLDLAKPVYPIFEDIKRYHDVFRVYTYPKKVIHNRHELRRFLRKEYFKLEDWQLEKVSEFFGENPGGIIRFA